MDCIVNIQATRDEGDSDVADVDLEWVEAAIDDETGYSPPTPIENRKSAPVSWWTIVDCRGVGSIAMNKTQVNIKQAVAHERYRNRLESRIDRVNREDRVN